MKKKIIITSILLIIIIGTIIIININKKEESNSYTRETYIDGKLASSLPKSGSGYEFESISCDNGGTATFNYSTWRVEVKNLSGKTKCTVSFKSSDKPKLVDYLKANANLVEENGLRYEGSKVNNYVLFNDELWRIIGVFNVYTASSGEQTQELVKLIRADVLDGLAFGSNNTWENSYLQNSLNNGYLNKEDGRCYVYRSYVAKECNFSETGINAGAREKIESVKWNIGKSTNSATAEAVYTNEITTKTNSYYKVGLMSASDYGYAVTQESCSRTTTLYNYNTSKCAGSNWLKNVGDEWTITYATMSNSMLYVGHSGGVYNYDSGFGYGVRPSVYLKSSVLYISGDGSHDNPFIIG